jgi:positive regulator of sigma E activity
MQSSSDEVKTWAIVKAVDDQGELLLEVSENKPNSCSTGGCGASGLGCQTNAFARLLKRAPALKLSLPIEQKVNVGDVLLLSLSASALMRLSLMAYGLPLLALLFGMAIGQLLLDDKGALLFGGFALLSSWYLIGKLNIDCTPSVQDIQRMTL